MILRVVGSAEDADMNIKLIEADISEITGNSLLIEQKLDLGFEGAKGDPVTVGVILLTMVGAGGAITASVANGGLLTKLAEILHFYINRGVELEVENERLGKLKLAGNVKDISTILEKHFSQDK